MQVPYILAILIPSVILIHRLRKTIYTMAEEKWRKEYETKQEMAQIAHDLKTPLTVIRGNAELLTPIIIMVVCIPATVKRWIKMKNG